ncbi:response regulator, partial [Candidatus Parcubacteria bacterium]
DLILLDLILPKKDGFEVLKELKSDEHTKAVPVIVLTNLEQSADVEKAIAFGATTYLVKANYSLDELLQKIKSVIG